MFYERRLDMHKGLPDEIAALHFEDGQPLPAYVIGCVCKDAGNQKRLDELRAELEAIDPEPGDEQICYP